MARPAKGGLIQKPSGMDSGNRKGVFQFFGEVISELKKVTWPSRETTTRLTILVIAVSATIGIALGGIDIIFTRVFDIALSLFN